MIEIDVKKIMIERCYVSLVSQNCYLFKDSIYYKGDFNEAPDMCKKLKKLAKIAADIYFETEID